MASVLDVSVPGFERKLTLHEKCAIVVDMGSEYIKYGFSGALCPRSVMVGNVMDSVTGRVSPVYDARRPDAVNERYMKRVVVDIAVNRLLCSGKERNVCVVESILSPTHLRHTIASAFFAQTPCANVLFVPQPLATATTYNFETALVVDIGYHEAQAVAVISGVVDAHKVETSPLCGARHLRNRLRSLLLKYARYDDGAPLHEQDITDDNVKGIFVKYCFATSLERGRALREWAYAQEYGNSSDRSAATLPIPAYADVRWPLSNGRRVKVPGFVRELCMESMFHPSSADPPCASLTELIMQVIANASMASRRSLASHVVLSGGVACMAGVHARTLEEAAYARARPYDRHMQHMYSAPPHSSLYLEDTAFRVHRLDKTAPLDNVVSWIGGSIIAACETPWTRGTTRKQWLEAHTLPDWCDKLPSAQLAGSLQRLVMDPWCILNEKTPAEEHDQKARARADESRHSKKINTQALLEKRSKRRSVSNVSQTSGQTTN